MMIELQPGDIFAIKGEGVAGWANSKLIAPPTDRLHYGLIWFNQDNDHLILESIEGKGIAVGRLSFYERENIKFYRVNCPKELRMAAPVELTKWGRSHYDWLLIPKLAIQGIELLIKHLLTKGKLRRIRVEELAWCHNNSFLCTEAVDIAYLAVGVSLTRGICPLPSAFKQAEFEGRITEIKETV